MSKLVTTESSSVYEVDEVNKKVRRLNGNADPTLRIGKSGEWKTFDSISGPEMGASMIIVWSSDTPLLPGSDGGVPTTWTSRVVSIEEVN